MVGETREGRCINYLYDREGRLTKVDTTGQPGSQRFDPDPNGNIRQSTVGSLVYDAANQLTTIDGLSIETDDLGNLCSIPTAGRWVEARFNKRSQLIEARLGNIEIAYAYDALGRLIERRTGHLLTRFEWAGDQLTTETSFSSSGAITETRHYLYLPGTRLPVAMLVDQALFYLHSGRRGEVLCVTDEAGDRVWEARYTPFGDCLIDVEKIRQPWRLHGHYSDPDSGLQYCLARWYAPELGRFLSRDPLLFAGGSDNFYLYCNGDPLNRIDPHGEFIFAANKLREFRGNDDLTRQSFLSGQEGTCFTSETHPDQTLKRWFGNQLDKMQKSNRLLREAGDAVDANPNLARDLKVAKIQEHGPDWIIRDFDQNSTALSKNLDHPEISAARDRLLQELAGSEDEALQSIYKKLNRNPPSANMHWSPTDKKIFVFDMQ